MRSSYFVSIFAVACLQACNIGGSGDSSSSGTSNVTTGGSNSVPTAQEIFAAAIEGTWVETACTATTQINSANAWYRSTISYNSDGTYGLSTVYYSDANCTTANNLIWVYTPGTYVVGSEVNAPSGGYAITYTTALSEGGITQLVHAYTAGAASFLDSTCSTSAFTAGANTGTSALTCASDSRFTTPASGTIADAVLVYTSSSALASTAYYENLPGVPNGQSVANSTSIDLQ